MIVCIGNSGLRVDREVRSMARGNQRDLAREKNLKKQQEQAKKKGAAVKGSNKGTFDLLRYANAVENRR